MVIYGGVRLALSTHAPQPAARSPLNGELPRYRGSNWAEMAGMNLTGSLPLQCFLEGAGLAVKQWNSPGQRESTKWISPSTDHHLACLEDRHCVLSRSQRRPLIHSCIALKVNDGCRVRKKHDSSCRPISRLLSFQSSHEFTKLTQRSHRPNFKNSLITWI